MNIFVVAAQPEIAARMLCDAHVVKMTLESAQLMSTVWQWYHPAPMRRPAGWPDDKPFPYVATHMQHPCTRWLFASGENYEWLAAHAIELAREYTKRFGRRHASQTVIEALYAKPYALARRGPTPHPLVMPDEYKVPGDAVRSYRAYYLGEKLAFASWRHSPTPHWVIAGNGS